MDTRPSLERQKARQEKADRRRETIRNAKKKQRLEQAAAPAVVQKKKPVKRAKPARPVKSFAVPAYRPGMGTEFYSTREWRELRWDVIKKSNRRCAMCGHTEQTSGKPLHVDHMWPRSKRPDLELTKSNLQVLCEDCNIGKGATYWDSTESVRD